MNRSRMITLVVLLLIVTPLALAGKKNAADDDRMQALEQKVADLEKAMEEHFANLNKQLEGHFSTMEKKIAEASMSGEQRESQAQAMLTEVNRLAAAGDFDQAKVKMNEMAEKYASTQTFRRASSLQQELAVVGKDAPPSYGIEKWFQGENETQMDNSQTTLIVFWEQWCPHCKREVPKIEQMYTSYKDKGLQVVGLTKITRSSTEENVAEFISQSAVSYPMAKEDGSVSSYFNVSGIPAAAVVKDGKIVWRGHPARLDADALKAWL